jgi:hypothetical protein
MGGLDPSIQLLSVSVALGGRFEAGDVEKKEQTHDVNLL